MSGKGHRPTVYMLIGCSGSGKTEFAKALKKNLGRFGEEYTIISKDEIRAGLAHNVSSDKLTLTEGHFVLNSDLKEIAERLFKEAIVSATLAGRNIIIDATNLRPDWRAKTMGYIRETPGASYYKVAVVFPEMETHELERRYQQRNQQRIKEGLPLRAMTTEELIQQQENRVVPTLDNPEGFNEIRNLSRDIYRRPLTDSHYIKRWVQERYNPPKAVAFRQGP